MGAGTILCHCCGRNVKLTRSAMIRGDIYNHPFLERLRRMADGIEPFDSKAYFHYKRDMTYRRAFICEACYKTIDNAEVGAAPIKPIDHYESRVFNLACRSRRGRAAVYDYKKWIAFQRRKAREMGVHLY